MQIDPRPTSSANAASQGSGGASATMPAAGGVVPPSPSLPKGGGAIRGMGEKFSASPVNGTGSLELPISTSAGRSGFGPQLALQYDSGAANGIFGLGWQLHLPSVTRKTDKGLPQYLDTADSDVFLLSGAEDLVPEYRRGQGDWVRTANGALVVHEDVVDGYRVRRYRPRVEGLHARIERWSRIDDEADVHWRSISRDNVLTLYGLTAESRIADPQDGRRIYSWLLCESRDDRGNAVLYRYKAEDGAGVALADAHQAHRGAADDAQRGAMRHLKRVLWGNRESLLAADGQRPRRLDAAAVQAQVDAGGWMFELVLDYGEHDANLPLPRDDEARDAQGRLRNPWAARPDAFSSYRAGFELRTVRRCRRALMFHHFPAAAEVGRDCVVRSTEFTYTDELPAAAQPAATAPIAYSQLARVTQTGWRRVGGVYRRRSLPPLDLRYSVPQVQEQVEEIDADSVRNLPQGLDGTLWRWVDLHGEGVPGLLTEQAAAWFYKRNLSPAPEAAGAVARARFAPLELVASKPNALLAGGAEIMDLAGDGQPDVVMLRGPTPGLYEHDTAEGWEAFRPFTSAPSRNLRDPHLRFIDLDGDGHADLLVTEDDALVWHASLAEAGFGPAQRVLRSLDEERGPRVTFADAAQSIHLADMSGDGLTDVVRVRNGEVCYWPNLGHGRFGAKVAMDGAPWFDAPEQFDPARLRLVDIDGSGTTDLVYLHAQGVRLYFNLSGNAWSAPRQLAVAPPVEQLATVQALDLLGNGTACLVWSSPLARDAGRPMRYVALMAEKPHLLVGVDNNLGAETRVQYAPATRFYLADRAAGQPWVTRLPFPVHVVERVWTLDHVARTRFCTRYAYHHGHYDGEEREFRGFGMVEQWDTEEHSALVNAPLGPLPENLDPAHHLPPVHTRSWFHTGICLGRERISRHFEGEYFREPGPAGDALLLEDTPLPAGLDVQAEREACRALRGSLLRQEVYADDAPAGATPQRLERAATPYNVTEQNFNVRELQPRGANRHGVYVVEPREALTCHYERIANDPRVQHTLTLEVNEWGQALKQVQVAYGRRAQVWQRDAQGQLQQVANPGFAGLLPSDVQKQSQTFLTCSETVVTPPVLAPDTHRAPQNCESRGYELTGFAATGPQGRYTLADLAQPDPAVPGAMVLRHQTELPFEAEPDGTRCRRLLEWTRTLYRRDDFGAGIVSSLPDGALPLGEAGALGLPFENYKLAFTPALLDALYRRTLPGQPVEALLPAPAVVLAQELAQARRDFYALRRWRDPFGQEHTASFDADRLLLTQTRDPLGNTVTVTLNDYRLLQPTQVEDANGNRVEVACDALGLVVATAVLGKAAPATPEGDSLAGLEPELSDTDLQAFFDANDPGAMAATFLGNASTRIVHDVHRFARSRSAQPQAPQSWQAVAVATLARETHLHASLPPQGLRVQMTVGYSDGFGREIQKKTQAEPGPLLEVGPTLQRRWVCSGWTLFNNKGLPVRQYEPFFTDTARFEFGVQRGVGPVLFYDPTGRTVATLHPNHSYEKVVFDAWRQRRFDVNDTVAPRNAETGDPRTDPDVAELMRAHLAAQGAGWATWHAERINAALGAAEQQAAQRAAAHADTPTHSHQDAQGRVFLTVSRNRVACPGHPHDGQEQDAATRTDFDIQGKVLAVHDGVTLPGGTQGRLVMRHAYDVLGRALYQCSMDAGARWTLPDVAGQAIRGWDARGHAIRLCYDALRRPTGRFVRGQGSACDPRTVAGEVMVERTEYGDGLANAPALNLRLRPWRSCDEAGVLTHARLDAQGAPVAAYDFKGNPLHATRQLTRDVESLADWSGAVPLQDERFENSTRYDALNRPVQSVAPHSDLARARLQVAQPHFNAAGLLESIAFWLQRTGEPGGLLDPAAEPPTAGVGVTRVDYDARGQRRLIRYANGASTHLRHDDATHRLVRLYTRRGDAFTGDCDNPQPPPATQAAPDAPGDLPNCGLQNLRYSYDAAGNLTHVRDDAQQVLYLRNQRVDPDNDYVYDAFYRLVQARGREQLDGNGAVPHDASDARRSAVPHPGDGDTLDTYLERYVYDEVGNLLAMQHRRGNPAAPGWSREYAYEDASLLEDGSGGSTPRVGNRLTRSTVSPDGGNAQSEPCTYDAHGNLLRMPHLGGAAAGPNLHWDHADRLRRADLGGGGTAFCVHDAAGQRVRKIWRKSAGLVEERIYLGGCEIFRRHEGAAAAGPWSAATASLERETLHVNDDQRRIALVETRTLDVAGTDDAPAQLVRYQLGNHLGSASLELDAQAQIISYEEYAPYGSTSYQARRSAKELPKRYRFTGKERDEETGLYYHGARYYAPWLGRWTSADPKGLVDGTNVFAYARGNPLAYVDPTGTQCDPTSQCCIDPTQSTPDDAQSSSSSSSSVPGGGAALTFLGLPKPTPATIPSAPPGTNFSAAAAQGRQAFRAANVMPPGTQAQHWTKELSAAAANMDPAVMNQNMSALQSRNALPATSLLVDPNGGGTTYSVSGGSTYGNEHKFADRFLIRQIEDQIRAANPNASASEVAIDAGRQARWAMTGDPGPAPTPAPAPASAGKTLLRAGGTGLAVVGTAYSAYAMGEDIKEGNFGSAALNGTGALGGGLALGGTAAGSTTLVTAGTVIGAPAAVVGAGIAGWKLGEYTNENTAISDVAMAGGDAVERLTGSPTLGAVGAAGTAVLTAPVFVPIAVGKGIGRGAAWAWNKVF